MRQTQSTGGPAFSVASPNYVIPAIRGMQAGREYYVAMIPLRLVPRIFVFDEDELPAELRAQRTLNKARVPEIARYLVENPKDYVFSSITASVDGEMRFMPASEGSHSDVGLLQIPMASRIIINDGQHRRAAIEEALKVRTDLGLETLSVVLFQDAGLRRCQQMFADLNRHAIRPTRSIGILYDRRDPFAQLALQVIEEVPIFKKFTDVEKTTISNRSLKLFTLNAIYQATRVLLGKTTKHSKPSQNDAEVAIRYWSAVAQNMPEWQLLLDRKVSAADLRRDYIHAHGITLQALGMVGMSLLSLHPKDWKQRLQRLQKIDWSRSNEKLWAGRATVNGRLSKRHDNITLTANALKRELGIPLDADAKALEKEYASRREG